MNRVRKDKIRAVIGNFDILPKSFHSAGGWILTVLNVTNSGFGSNDITLNITKEGYNVLFRDKYHYFVKIGEYKGDVDMSIFHFSFHYDGKTDIRKVLTKKLPRPISFDFSIHYWELENS